MTRRKRGFRLATELGLLILCRQLYCIPELFGPNYLYPAGSLTPHPKSISVSHKKKRCDHCGLVKEEHLGNDLICDMTAQPGRNTTRWCHVGSCKTCEPYAEQILATEGYYNAGLRETGHLGEHIGQPYSIS